MATSQLEITVRSRRPIYSMPQTPAADGSLADGAIQHVRGLAFQESATPDKAELATGAGPSVGFVTRPIAKGGPQLADSIYPGRIELPTVAGEEASFEDAEVVEAEGSDYICGTGARAIDNTTARNTPLSFDAGRFCKATTGQLAGYELVAQLTPIDSGNNCRIRARKIGGDIQ